MIGRPQWSFLGQHTAQFNVPNAGSGSKRYAGECNEPRLTVEVSVLARSERSEPRVPQRVALWEIKMAHNRNNVGFFSLIAVSLLAAALLVSLLVGGEISGPKVALVGTPPITAR